MPQDQLIKSIHQACLSHLTQMYQRPQKSHKLAKANSTWGTLMTCFVHHRQRGGTSEKHPSVSSLSEAVNTLCWAHLPSLNGKHVRSASPRVDVTQSECSPGFPVPLSACLPSESDLFMLRGFQNLPQNCICPPPTSTPTPHHHPRCFYFALAAATFRGWKSPFGVTRAAAIIATRRASAWEISAKPAMKTHRFVGFRGQMLLIAVQDFHFDSMCLSLI